MLRISRRAWAALRGRARFITRHRQAYMTRGRMLCDTVNQRETLRISTLFAGAAAMKRDPHAARDAAGRAVTGEDGPARRSHALLTLTLPRLLARRCPGKLRLSRRSPSGPRPRFASSSDRGKLRLSRRSPSGPRPRFASSSDRGKLSPVALPPGGNSFRRTENRLGEYDCHETSVASIVALAAGRPIDPYLTPRRGGKKRSITEGLPLISIGRGRREEKASIRSRMRSDAAV